MRVVTVFPELLGTYGDGGNAVVLAQRLRWRGIDADLIEAPIGSPLPRSADIYCLGGGEDGPQGQAGVILAQDSGLVRAVESGAAVLAVCAGFQVLGRSFPGPDGAIHAGLDLIDAATAKGRGRRLVGEVVSRPDPEVCAAGLGSNLLTGYENHAGITTIGPGAQRLGRVTTGGGNGVGDRAEGAWCGRIVGTYMHGPVLARNPHLADFVLGLALGPDVALGHWSQSEMGAPLDSEVERLRTERLSHPGYGRGSLGSRARHGLSGLGLRRPRR